eukprot:TRINITY_DN15390_c0_g1_i1.p2 TRINITY_DN15390_c0_g1~~TRINITY_DN15390_c0_g1_i1.p2  ORF type:complete len:218 (+),score=68.27 TRINITY_DN15390_c0_g1_i1:75-656(+)
MPSLLQQLADPELGHLLLELALYGAAPVCALVCWHTDRKVFAFFHSLLLCTMYQLHGGEDGGQDWLLRWGSEVVLCTLIILPIPFAIAVYTSLYVMWSYRVISTGWIAKTVPGMLVTIVLGVWAPLGVIARKRRERIAKMFSSAKALSPEWEQKVRKQKAAQRAGQTAAAAAGSAPAGEPRSPSQPPALSPAN